MYQEYVLRVPRAMPTRPAGLYAPIQSAELGTASQTYAPETQVPVHAVQTRYQEIQPRPPNLPPGAGAAMSPTSEPPRKKRGRPTKVELEMRREAAKARGDAIPEFRRDTVHAGSSHAPMSVAAQAAQAVMGPNPPSSRPATTPEILPANRKRPLSGEGPEGPRPTSAATEDDPGERSQAPLPSASRASHRDYPQILSHDSTGGTSTFKAPRGGE
ncbi:hypothetical protein ANO11243_016460 [Dothideomycetidae sp. 11243]|nr:hypothetical protein ANO11243_016460 [fungal sp. No.11243]